MFLPRPGLPADPDERDGIQAVGGDGGPLFIQHGLGIAVIRGEEHGAAPFQYAVHHHPGQAVHGLHGPDRCLQHPGVPHHVPVGKVHDHRIVVIELRQKGIHHLRGAHLRQKIVGRHLRGGDHDPVLPGEGILAPPVEEEGHMGELLGLGDPELCQAVLREDLTQHVLHAQRREGHGGIQPLLVPHHGGEVHPHIRPTETGELAVREGMGELAGPIRSEVEENHLIPVPDEIPGHRSGAGLPVPGQGADHRGHHELIPLPPVVGIPEGGEGIRGPETLPPDQGIVAQLCPLPAVVPVHGVVPAGNVRDPAAGAPGQPALQFPKVSLCHPRAGIPAVQEDMYHEPDPQVTGHLHEGEEVVTVGMDPSVREHPHEVDGPPLLPGPGHGPQQDRVVLKAPVRDLTVEAHQWGEDHPAGTDVQVAHLGVPHLTRGEAHMFAAGVQRDPRVFPHPPVEIRGGGQGHGIPGSGIRQTQPITDHEDDHGINPPFAGFSRNTGSCSFMFIRMAPDSQVGKGKVHQEGGHRDLGKVDLTLGHELPRLEGGPQETVHMASHEAEQGGEQEKGDGPPHIGHGRDQDPAHHGNNEGGGEGGTGPQGGDPAVHPGFDPQGRVGGEGVAGRVGDEIYPVREDTDLAGQGVGCRGGDGGDVEPCRILADGIGQDGDHHRDDSVVDDVGRTSGPAVPLRRAAFMLVRIPESGGPETDGHEKEEQDKPGNIPQQTDDQARRYRHHGPPGIKDAEPV